MRNRFIRVAENEVCYIGRWTRAAGTRNISSKIILATDQDRAIDLSCRACGAGAWALGLDSRLGPSAFFPTSDKLPQHMTPNRFAWKTATMLKHYIILTFYGRPIGVQ